MAKFMEDQNLFLNVSKNLLFFEWTISEGNFNERTVLSRSATFYGREGEGLLLMTATRKGICIVVGNPKIISGGYYFLNISDSSNKSIYNVFKTTKDFHLNNYVNLVKDFREKLLNYPVLISCIVKSPNINISLETNNHARSNHLEQLSADLKKYLHQTSNSDTVLNVDGENIKCHKFILQARSPVFNRMFCNDSSESNDGTVVIPDISASAMKRFLDFLYAGTVDECNFDEIFELYYAADKYEVLSLRDDCKNKLLSSIKVDNACDFFVLANQHNDEDFLKEVMKFISNNFDVVVVTDSFYKLSKDDVKSMMIMYAQAKKNSFC